MALEQVRQLKPCTDATITSTAGQPWPFGIIIIEKQTTLTLDILHFGQQRHTFALGCLQWSQSFYVILKTRPEESSWLHRPKERWEESGRKGTWCVSCRAELSTPPPPHAATAAACHSRGNRAGTHCCNNIISWLLPQGPRGKIRCKNPHCNTAMQISVSRKTSFNNPLEFKATLWILSPGTSAVTVKDPPPEDYFLSMYPFQSTFKSMKSFHYVR